MVASVAVVGAGEIGAPVARRIAQAGFALTVCDLDERRLEPFRQAGAHTARVPSACADAEVVLVLVANDSQLRDVVLGAEGLAVAEGRMHSLAVMSTVSPEALSAVADPLRSQGIRVIDAPVSGGAARAKEGRLTIMAGGERQDLERVRPVLDCVASHIFHCGPLGTGQIVKIINNVLCHANTFLTAEAYRLGIAHGLRPEMISPVLEVSTGRNYLTAEPGGAAQAFAGFARDRGAFDTLLSILKKDLGLAAGLIAAAPEQYPAIRAIASTAAALGDETYQTWLEIGAAAT